MDDPELQLVLICDNIRSLFEQITIEQVSQLEFLPAVERNWDETIGEPLDWEDNVKDALVSPLRIGEHFPARYFVLRPQPGCQFEFQTRGSKAYAVLVWEGNCKLFSSGFYMYTSTGSFFTLGHNSNMLIVGPNNAVVFVAEITFP